MAAEGSIVSTGTAAATLPQEQSHGRHSSSQTLGKAPSDEHAFITVRELMRMESEQALVLARQRRKQGVESLRPPVQGEGVVVPNATETLRLVGIYGVGKRLFAEVRDGSQAWLFLNGHSLPVGHTAGAGLYRLKEVAGACVHLEQQGVETTLCLPRAGRQ